jgi:hypothetical protein
MLAVLDTILQNQRCGLENIILRKVDDFNQFGTDGHTLHYVDVF